MDELLAFSNDKNNNDNINDYTKEYINELITLENMQSSKKSRNYIKAENLRCNFLCRFGGYNILYD